MKKLLISVVIILFILPLSSAQTIEKKRYKATRTIEAPVINGILDEEIWKSGEWIDDFTQNEPYNGSPASQRTEFTILFDDDNLYVGIKAYDTSPTVLLTVLPAEIRPMVTLLLLLSTVFMTFAQDSVSV